MVGRELSHRSILCASTTSDYLAAAPCQDGVSISRLSQPLTLTLPIRLTPYMIPPCPAALTKRFSPSGCASLPIAAGLIMNGHRVGSPRIVVPASTCETSTITRGRRRTRR